MKPTREQLPGILTSVPGFTAENVAYYAFSLDNAPGLPFIVYSFGEETSLYADGLNGYTTTRVVVELYTKRKDIATEQLIEAAFAANEIAYTKDGQYLEDEDDHVTVYEFDLQN